MRGATVDPGPLAATPRWRRTVAGRCAASALVALLAGCAGERPAGRPDVVLVVVDTLRRDSLPEYGFGLPTSGAMAPYLADAVRFERAYSTSSWTKPAVGSIFSGLLPARHGAADVEGKKLAAAIETLPEMLASAGWNTAGFSHNVNVSRQTGFDQGFAHFSVDEAKGPSYADVDEMVEEARRWLARAGRQPFFIYLQPMNVHGPYWVPPERQRDLYGRDPGRGFVYLGPIHRAVMEKGVRHRSLVTEEMVVGLRERYATAVRYTMDRLAVLFDELRRRGRYDEALIVLTSDHGEELYDHGGFSHGHSLFEEVVRVPLFVKLPRSLAAEAPRVVEAAASLADLLPTVAAALRLSPPPELDGRSLWGELSGGSRVPADREIYLDVRLPKHCVATGLIVGAEKWIDVEEDYEGRRRQELRFDLATDPFERIDLVAKDAGRSEALRAATAAWRRRLAARALDLSGEADATVDREALRALGYLD